MNEKEDYRKRADTEVLCKFFIYMTFFFSNFLKECLSCIPELYTCDFVPMCQKHGLGHLKFTLHSLLTILEGVSANS